MMNRKEMNDTVKNTENGTVFQKVVNWFRQYFNSDNIVLVDPAQYLYMNQCI